MRVQQAKTSAALHPRRGWPHRRHQSASVRRDYNYFRDYEPGTGRYVESDPIGQLGGLSTYGYVGSTPLSLGDPLGLDPACELRVTAQSVGIGAAAGALVGCVCGGIVGAAGGTLVLPVGGTIAGAAGGCAGGAAGGAQIGGMLGALASAGTSEKGNGVRSTSVEIPGMVPGPLPPRCRRPALTSPA